MHMYAYALILTHAHTHTHTHTHTHVNLCNNYVRMCVSFNSHCLTVGTTHIHSDLFLKNAIQAMLGRILLLIGHHKSLFVKILCI